MHYRSIDDLNRDMKHWLLRLPQDIEVVAGLPRSGMLAANMLVLHMNLPLTDVEGLIEGRILMSGPRCAVQAAGDFLQTPRKVLVLDDCVFTGKQIENARCRINDANLPHQVLYAGVYVEPQKAGLLDFYCKCLPWPQLFEWNIMHHWILQNSCVDIDGVLCRDPSAEEDDDGPAYEAFIRDARPFIRVSRKIGWLVTCRLEKYRMQTEEWLARHGIQYDKLIMLDLPDKRARLRARCDAAFKAQTYRSTNASLFIESSRHLSAAVANMTGREVFCTESAEMYYPGTLRRFRVSNARVLMHKALANPLSALATARRMAGHAVYRAKLFAFNRPQRAPAEKTLKQDKRKCVGLCRTVPDGSEGSDGSDGSG